MGLCSITIIAGGRELTPIYYNGKSYLAVPDVKTEYTIRATNLTSERLCVVGSVDGLSIMDGGDAHSTNSGYVLDAYGSIDIKGWRRGPDNVAAFEFGSKAESYGAKLG